VCTEFDRLVLLRNDGTCRVISVPEKEYIGPTKYVMLWNKDQVYSILYRDRQEGTWFVKRFTLEQFTLGREYHIVPPNCLIENLYTNSGVVLSLELAPNNRRSYHSVTVEFDQYALRSREAKGYKLTQYPVTTINVIKRGSAITPPQNDEGSDDEQVEDGQPASGEPDTTPVGDDTTAVGIAAKQNGKNAPPVATATKPGHKAKTAEATPAEATTAEATTAEATTDEAKNDEAQDDDQKDAGDDGGQAGPDVDAVKNGAAKGMSRLRKLIDEDTPFFLED